MPDLYFESSGISRASWPDRTYEDKASFDWALHEMTRLYAFKGNDNYRGVEVIVLPEVEKVQGKWGKLNKAPYPNRGWCVAEFSVANHNDIIAPKDDPEVAEVLRARRWPRTIEYQDMCKTTDQTDSSLDHDPREGVAFTSRGDRRFVEYNFFKMALEPVWPADIAQEGRW